MAKKPRKYLPLKLKAVLQQEIQSKCPFCDNDDVACFEAHHIDEDPANTILENLILVCPTCHTKISKGIITRQRVDRAKNNIRLASSKIEVYKISIASAGRDWSPIPGTENAFQHSYSRGNTFPVLQFHFTNHFNRSMVLKDIELQARHLFSGFGDLYQPMEVPESNVYKIIMNYNNSIHHIRNFNGIQIPGGHSLIFQVMLLQRSLDGFYNLYERMLLDFTLYFSNNVTVHVPRILLNTDNENDGVKLVYCS